MSILKLASGLIQSLPSGMSTALETIGALSGTGVLEKTGAGAGDWALTSGGLGLPGTIAVRQAIQNAPVNSDGRADFLASPSGFTVQGQNISESNPLILAITDTPDSQGRPRDRVIRITTNPTWPSPTANTTSFFLVEENEDDSISYLTTTLAPSYGLTLPPSPVTGQMHYNTNHTGRAVVWDGTAWVPRRIICVGEAVTDASTVTGLASYAILGRWIGTTDATSTSSQTISINHHIGTELVGLGNLWLRDVTNSRWVLKGFPQGYPPTTVRDANLSAITTSTALFNVIDAHLYRHSGSNVTPASWFFRLSLNRGFR
jgi:hypothetical protein